MIFCGNKEVGGIFDRMPFGEFNVVIKWSGKNGRRDRRSKQGDSGSKSRGNLLAIRLAWFIANDKNSLTISNANKTNAEIIRKLRTCFLAVLVFAFIICLVEEMFWWFSWAWFSIFLPPPKSIPYFTGGVPFLALSQEGDGEGFKVPWVLFSPLRGFSPRQDIFRLRKFFCGR